MVIMELKNLDRKLRYDIEIFMVKKSWVVNEGRADEFINYLEEKITKDELFKYTEYREEEGAN